MKIVTAMSLVASLAVSSAFSMEWAFEVYKKVSSFTASRTEVSVPSAESLDKEVALIFSKRKNIVVGYAKVTLGALQFGPDIKKILAIDPAIENDPEGYLESVLKQLVTTPMENDFKSYLKSGLERLATNGAFKPIDVRDFILEAIPGKIIMNELIVEKNGIFDLNGCDLEVENYDIEGELINTGHRNASFIYPDGRITVPAK